MDPLRSPERPIWPHTISQRQNVPNYHFHLGIISVDDPPDLNYEPPLLPPQFFQSSQKTLTMEGHLPYLYLFDQIILQQFWKKLNKKVYLSRIPRLYCGLLACIALR